ncbi:hypothetical protein N2152v2_006719 [Parachlorella kessleri]
MAGILALPPVREVASVTGNQPAQGQPPDVLDTLAVQPATSTASITAAQLSRAAVDRVFGQLAARAQEEPAQSALRDSVDLAAEAGNNRVEPSVAADLLVREADLTLEATPDTVGRELTPQVAAAQAGGDNSTAQAAGLVAGHARGLYEALKLQQPSDVQDQMALDEVFWDEKGLQERRQELQRRLKDEEMVERIRRRVAGDKINLPNIPLAKTLARLPSMLLSPRVGAAGTGDGPPSKSPRGQPAIPEDAEAEAEAGPDLEAAAGRGEGAEGQLSVQDAVPAKKPAEKWWPKVQHAVQRIVQHPEIAINVVFTIEVILVCIAAGGFLEYIRSPWNIFDLTMALPMLISVFELLFFFLLLAAIMGTILFMLSSWVHTMYATMDSAGIPSLIYFIGIVLLESYFVVNLFLAVLKNKFAKASVLASKSLTRTPQLTAHSRKQPQGRLGSLWYWFSSRVGSCWFEVRWRVHDVVEHPAFTQFFLVAIVANTILLAMTTANMSQAKASRLNQGSNVLTYFFMAEFALKILGLGPWGYFGGNDGGMNTFDFLIVVMSLVDIVTQVGTNGNAMRSFRTLRILRSLRVLRVLKSFGQLDLDPSYPNLNNGWNAIVVVFQTLTLENWAQARANMMK